MDASHFILKIELSEQLNNMVKFRNTKRRLKRFTEKVLLPSISVIGLGYCYYKLITIIGHKLDESFDELTDAVIEYKISKDKSKHKKTDNIGLYNNSFNN